jgi:hypothetical protein
MNWKQLAMVILWGAGKVCGTELAVDPAGRLSGTTVLGEWATNGNAEGWTGSNVTGLVATNGVLAGSDATGGADASLSRTALDNGPDLDLGFNDYLQLRLKVPPGYTGDILLEYGTTVNTGFSSDRRVTIPAVSIPQDSAFHVYRLDLGLEVWWRDTLRDLRVTPLLSATGAFELDYLEVGDVAGTAPALNLDTNFLSPLNAATTSRLEGKHVCVWWDPANALFTTAHARHAIRMCEESYQVYCRKLGYSEPFYEFDNTNSARYKVNFITWYGGFWAGGYANRPHLNIGAGGLADEGWGNPVPHEFAHCVQMAQAGRLTGGHWESHANYLRAGRNLHFYAAIPGAIPALDNLTGNSNYRPDHLRHIYADQRYYLSLDDYGAGFGLPKNYAAVMWREGARDKTIIEKLAAALPFGTSVKDVAAECMKRWPMLDFVEKTRIRAQHWGSDTARAEHFWRQGAQLVPQQDKPGWWRVPFERAPDQWAYMMHELIAPAGTVITVEVRGVDLSGADEDWRWCLAAVKADDTVRYSPVLAPGATTFTPVDGETSLFLIVTATPSGTGVDLGSLHNTKPTDKQADRLRYAYEVRLVNATPAAHGLAVANPPGTHLHANGGGVVGPSATVDATAYVGPNAKVLDSARVLGTARVEDRAVVQGSATVKGSAVVSGGAWVYGSATVQDNTRVRDRVEVRGGTVVKNRALVAGYACLDNVTVQDDAAVRGSAGPFGGTISGTAIADHDYSMDFSFSSGAHFCHIPWGGWFDAYYTQTLRTPRGLFASYRTEETSGQVWWDEFGAQHALLRGAPARETDSCLKSPVLTLDGLDDYAVLDRSVADTPLFSYTCWIKPARDPGADEPLLFLGSGASKALTLTRSAGGKLAFSLSDGTTSFNLTSTSDLTSNIWRHVAVTLDGVSGTLYLDGKPEAAGNTTLTPLNILAANDHVAAQANYLGRDWAGALFKGGVEDARFHHVALTAAEVREAYQRKGGMLGLFAASAATDCNGTSTTGQSGVRNGRVRTLCAWVKPRTSDNVSNYEAVFDSQDERSERQGGGFGLDNGMWIVRLDGLGNWDTGVLAARNQWQHVALAFDGATANLFINGRQAATRTYTGPSDDTAAAGQCYRLGFSQISEDTATRQYFDGLILNAQIHDRVLAAGEFVFDTDGDGVNDTVEADFGADPLDPLSTPPQYAISGRVRDVTAAVVTNATVYFSTAPDARANATASIGGGGDGRYRQLVTPGTWYVTVAAPGFNAAADRMVMVSGSDVPEVNFALTSLAKVSGTVTRRADGGAVSGALVWFSRSAGASANPALTVQTGSDGEYAVPLENGLWYVSAGGSGHYPDSERTLTLSGAALANVSFALVPQTIPQANDLLFAALTDALPASGGTVAWPAYRPAGQVLSVLGSPTVETLNGVRWVKNSFNDGDGFRQGTYSSPIPINGATIIVVAKPLRNTTSTSWTSIVDLFYDRLTLGIRNNSGTIDVLRNGVLSSSAYAIPDGQATILSLVVQPTGTFKVYANGAQVMDIAAPSAMTALVPNVPGGYANAFNVGRNNPDSWTTFNGNIGDVFVYTNALSGTERQLLEATLGSRFIRGALSQPADLAISMVSCTQASIQWADTSINEEGFRVERRVGGTGVWSLVSLVAANATSYSDSGLSDGVSYDYRVAAYNASDFSAVSSLTLTTPSLASYRLPFVETFEDDPTNMAHTVGAVHGQHGWEADPPAGAEVQTNRAYVGWKAAAVAAATLSHRLEAGGTTTAWFDFALQPHWNPDETEMPLEQAASVAFHVNQAGRVVVQSGAAWRVCDAFAAASNEWVRFTAKLNYATRKWALYATHEALGSVAVSVARDLDFVTGSTNREPHAFQVTLNGGEPTCLDNVAVTDEAVSGAPGHIGCGMLMLVQ